MHNRKTRLLAMLLALLTVFLLSATALAAEKETETTGEYMRVAKAVNVRTGPGTKYDKIGSLKKDTIVLRLDTSGSWSVISLGEDQTAYVSSSYLKSAPNVDASKLNEGYTPVASSGKTSTSTAKKGSLEDLINSAKLSPLKTGDRTLDQKIAAVFDKVSDADDTTYEKLRAFYGWLVNNTKDLGTGYSTYYLNGSPYRSFNDTVTVYFAKQQFSTMEGGRGTCDLYVATLMVAARHLGLEAYEGHGVYVNSSGKRSPHSWMFLMLDGKAYIFDAQLEFNNTKGKADYSRFGVRGEKWDKRYVMDGTLKQAMTGFNNFKK